MNRDNGFGDAFAQEVLNVMNSKEHKEIFKKAQHSLFGGKAEDYNPLSENDYDPSMHSPKGVQGPEMKDWGTKVEPVGGQDFVFPDEGVSDEATDAAILEAKADRVFKDPTSPGDVLMVANKVKMGEPLSFEEKELLLNVNASNKRNLNKEGLDVDLGVKDKAKERKLKDHKVKDPEGVEGTTMQERSQANKKDKKSSSNSLYNKFAGGEEVSRTEWATMTLNDKQNYVKMFGYPSWMSEEEKAEFKKEGANVLNTIISLGDYLGENGFVVSEKLADRLMKSFIVEASNKFACDEYKCEKCECDPCDCDEDKKKPQE